MNIENIDKEKVVQKIREAKQYGLNYSDLARQINITPTRLSLFISGKQEQMKPIKQLEAMAICEKHIQTMHEKLKIIEGLL